jgi:hypothetical protein
MPFSPLFMKDCTFEIEGTDYAGELSSVRFAAASSQVEYKGLKKGSKYTESTDPSYTCVTAYAQDWENATSWSNALIELSGTTQLVTFKPKAAGTVGFTANLSIVPGDIGGEVDAYATSTVTLGSDEPQKITVP